MEQNESGSNTTLKWLVGILVVVIISLIGYIVYSKSVSKPVVSTNTPSDNTVTTTPTNSNASTADWKTYTNKDLGFSFKYPSDWAINDAFLTDPLNATYPHPTFLNISKKVIVDGEPTSIIIGLGWSSGVQPSQLKDWFDKTWKRTIGGDITDVTTKYITLLGNPAVYQRMVVKGGTPGNYTVSKWLYFTSGNRVYDLTGGYFYKDGDKVKDTDNIEGTFDTIYKSFSTLNNQ